MAGTVVGPTVTRADGSSTDIRGLVSVVTPFYNAGAVIGQAIESVLSQSYKRVELLLVDDGAEDSSRQIALSYQQAHPDRIKYLHHDERQNRGASAARNLGLRQARGEYIAFLDADDLFLENQLAEQVAALEFFRNAQMVCGRALYWQSWTGDPRDRDLDFVEIHHPGVAVNTVVAPPKLLELALRDGGYMPCPCSVLVKAEAVRAVDGWEDHFDSIYGDQAFYSKLFLTINVVMVPNVWGKYRRHRQSMCSVALQKGDWHPVLPNRRRGYYLRWLETYLKNQPRRHATVRRILAHELRPYRHPMMYKLNESYRAMLRGIRSLGRFTLRRLTGRSLGFIEAIPNPIPVNDTPVRGITTLRWRVKGATAVEVRVSSPDGRLVSQAGGPGSAVTGRWVRHGETFYLQDVSDSRPLTAAHTLATVTVTLVGGGISIRRSPLAPVSTHVRALARFWRGSTYVPAVGAVWFGDLRRVKPIGPPPDTVHRGWGFDRGSAIDRYYIERFLARHAEDVRGRVLEIRDNTYTRRFGGFNVEVSEVLSREDGVPGTTIVADLANAPHVPSGTFDCIILTQTLQLIYDARAVIRTLHRLLKPGGVVLATVPGITQTYGPETAGSWYWSFTSASATRLFAEAFSEPNIEVRTHGNVLVACSFLHGLAAEELRPAELDAVEPGYECLITIRAMKSRTDSDGVGLPVHEASAT